ncbi:hypothetical protein B9Z55_019089 [Caenorhabditis nigoni]|uniref:Aminotransferase class I/classII large domain-containing protein n=1 Tax=Caenorhabditis nigoni TaxID=1611254 RepID=A0A2G5TH38_9PELO|nr:hypothetical protein B9Z55_019089 [Caenorhabditis nigoni]
MMIAAPTPSSKRTEDDRGNFSADSQSPPLNSDDEQLDDTPFLSHQLPDDHESFSEKFLRNILTHDYQNLMPRRREKFVEITKTVTVTEIVNGAPDKHPSSCEVKVTNVSPAGPHPVNVSIKHLHEKWHSCEELDKSDDGGDLGKGTVIRIQETHKPFNYTQKRQQPSKFVYEDVMNTKMESSTKPRQPSSANSTLFNRSSDNIIDLEFRHPILVETSEKTADDQKHQQQNGNNGTRRRFADLRKKVSTTTKTSVTETEKVTTARRSSSAHSTSSKRSYSKPEVHTLYYRKFVDEETKGGDDDSSDSGSVIIHRDSVTRRSRSADHLQQTSPQTMSPIAPPRKRLGREESLHYYRDDEEVLEEQTETEKKRRVTLRSPEPGNTSISMNDTAEKRNITAGITSISMNDTCTDTSFESRFSTIPRARSSPPGTHRVNHIHVNVIGPIRTPETERKHRVVGRVGDDVTMDIFIERRRSSPNSRRGSHVSHGSTSEAPPKPPRRSKYEDHVRIGDPIATSTPMTTIERKQTREERVSTESGQSSRKSTRSARPPDINIIECETFIRETRSPARTPATPIVVINQTPSSRRGSQDLLGEPGQRRRKSTVTDIDWYAAFNMKDPSSPTKLARPPFVSHSDDRKTSRDVRRRASDSSMIGLPPADIDLNQIFSCTAPPEIKNDEKCQCNACRLIRMSEAERKVRIERSSRSRQSRSFTKTTEYETRASTLPSRHRTSPLNIELEDIFNPKPSSPPSTTTKPPTPPSRRRHAPTSPTAPSQSSIVDESSRHLVTTTIDRKQVTPVTTNSRDPQLHARDQLLNSSDDWVGQMMNDANEWENRVSSRKSSVLSTSSSSARKVSVARRISIDELKKPEKRKSREAVPLPPSDHSIDDIFTALTTKKDDVPKETERKTFIVTRKQRAQDVDIIDFEKDRETPVAPPRHKNIHSSEAKIVLKDNSEDPVVSSQISTATINLEDVFTNRENSTRTQETDEEDEKIRKRVAEFTKAQQEKEMSRSEKTIDEKSRTAMESNISMDDVFGSPKIDSEIPLNEDSVTSTASIEMKSSESHPEFQSNGEKGSTDMPDVIATSSTRMRPSEHGQHDNSALDIGKDEDAKKKENRTSAVSIDLDKVFVEGSTEKSDFDASDEKIRRGIAEFERAKQEKDAQRSGIVVTTYSWKHLFDESDISMDDVFNPSQRGEKSSVEMKRPDETTTATTSLSNAPKDTVEISLDNVFVERNEEKPSEVDEEEKHIRKRMEEFKKAEEEKHIQQPEEPHPSHHVFDESNISMDDIFNVSHSGINQSQDVDQEEEHIRRRIQEFKKAEEEKQRNLIVESHSSHQTFDASNISMDDVFNRSTSSPEPSTPTHSERSPSPTEATDPVDTKPTSGINLDNVFVQGRDERPEVDQEEKHIRMRMEEFKKAEEEKQVHLTTESHAIHHVLDDSKISLDDVFNTSLPQRSKQSEDVAQEEQHIRRRIEEFKKAEEEKQLQIKPESRSSHTTLISSNISMDDVFNTPRPNVTSSESINLDRDSASDKDGKPADDADMSQSVVNKTISDEDKKEISTASISMRSPETSEEPHSKEENENRTSAVSIDLDKVFVEGSAGKSDIDASDEKIRRGIAEFERAKQEKDAQRSGVVVTTHSSKHLFDESDISMDDVFNTSQREGEHLAQIKRPDQTSTATISLSKESAGISLDDVFVEGHDEKPSEVDEEEKHIRKRMEEFKKAEEEKHIQQPEEPHPAHHDFDESNISMDDVFNVSHSGINQSEDVDQEEQHIRRRIEEFKKAEEEKQRNLIVESHSPHQTFDASDISMDDVFNRSTLSPDPSSEASSKRSPSPTETTSHVDTKPTAEISLDNVFVETHDEKPSEVEEEEKHIRKRMEEFEKAEEEKLIQKSEGPHPSHHVFNESNISMDDIFNVSHSGINQSKDVDQEEEHIRRRIEEFKKAEEEKQRNLIVESHSSHQTFDASNISMDDVFNRSTSSPEPSTEARRLPSPTEPNNPVDTKPSESQFTLEDVFVQGSSTKPNSDASDERIRKGFAEFEKASRDKEVQGSVSTKESETKRKDFDDSNISLDDVFNTTPSDSRRSEHQPSSSEGRPEFILSTDEDTKTKTETTTTTETEIDTTYRRVCGSEDPSGDAAQPAGSQENVTSTESVKLEDGKRMVSTAGINLDDIFVQGKEKSKKDDEDQIGIESRNPIQKKESQQSLIVEHSLTKRADMDEQSVSLEDVFNTTSEKEAEDSHNHLGVTSTSSIRMRSSDDQYEMRKEPENIEELPEENRTSAVSIDLDKVFVEGSAGKSDFDASDEKIRRGIAEFERAKQEKDAQRSGVVVTTHSSKHLFDESDISMDDVFNTSKRLEEPSVEINPDKTSTATMSLSDAPKESVEISLDNVFVEGHDEKPSEVDEEEKHIRKRMEEFRKAEDEKHIQKADEPHPSHHVFNESNISMDDVFNVSHSGTNQSEDVDQEEQHIRRRIEEFKKAEEEKQRNLIIESHPSHQTFDASNISMDDVFNTSSSSRKENFENSCVDSSENRNSDSGFKKTTSETSTTTTTTRTETSSDSYSKRTVTTLDDLFGPQTCTPPVISISAISLDPNQPSTSPTPPPRKHQNLSSLLVPGKWNESMMSNASTISLDDSFNNSFTKSGNSQVHEPKMRKPLALPVDNWIDNLVATVTDEATREAPKTPKSAIEDYYRSPTRISQEIKYEWVAKLIEDDANKDHEEEKEEHQSEEEHLQKPDDTWVSSVVYRPTLETSTYTLRSSQMEPERKAEIDMDRVFNECLIGKHDDEECECSACRLTEQELEDIKRRKIETQKKTREERQSVSHDSEERRTLTIMNPSEFSIDDVFNLEAPLTIQTDHAPAPSTSSPPLQSTRTYYISPKVSETVTTTHQWKDADISMDEIFSPVSSTTNENRRFSNFYEDRSGWDTIGSEDSGVMSGGDRGRRRSTRITDHVIDEAFKGIFDSQPTTSTAAQEPDKEKNNYDDYYITSIHQEEIGSSDSDVDPENLDVSQFVDDILGKSMDEAAFLSSTKSLRDHTDTSIDRKKSNEKLHSYYRTRTDTSIDRRVKPEVINEDLESSEAHDELLKLVFVDPSDSSSISKSDSRRSLSLPRNRSITRPSDEELLEIETKPDYFVIKGSYSLLIPKSDPLGLMLQKLREQNNGLATLDFSLTRKLKKLLVNCIREKAGCLDMSSDSSKYEGLLSSRGQSLIESIDHASATFLKMNVDKYEPTRNPNGVVNFCTAENNICTPLLEERFKHLELFFPNTEHLVRYPPGGGWPEAREVLVKYFREFMGARVTIDELALTPSTRTGYDVTSYCLFEADDILLTNGPAYAGTISNVQEKAQCVVACVETDLSNPRLDVNKYEEELKRQTDLENTVSGVIIVNPHNPLGVTFPPEDVVNLCNWATSKNLHVVIDEVFANCVFDRPNSKFRPFLSYRHRVHRPENVAWLWSVSKDFGLPGLKFAVIHSANEGLRRAATKLQMYYPCSPFVQDFAINLLSDSIWLREFHTEVNRRISIHYRYTAQNLEILEIPFVPAQAGIFVFADFSKHLSTVDSAGELELFENLASAGVMLTPGVHQNCHVFGWFRIVFACTKEELEEGFRRLFTYFKSHLHPIGTVQYDN